MNQIKKQSDCTDFNRLSQYLALRDCQELSAESVEQYCGVRQVEMLLIAGNCLPVTAKIAAKAYHDGVVKTLFITGDKGHTTNVLIQHLKNESLQFDVEMSLLSEAELFTELLAQHYQIPRKCILTEKKARNGGENASETLKTVTKLNKIPQTMILIQDPTMQRRLDASFRKYWAQTKTTFINYAPFIPTIAWENGEFVFEGEEKMGRHWEMDYYLSLVLGEIPRLVNDKNGYGSNGKQYIADVAVPTDVIKAFHRLEKKYPTLIRQIK